ncbi:hypothetical protein OIU78_013412 [Salix suchowensis]|nr:hypothetical protein OIU78_013412 [Salix suchowensis]
MFFDFLIIIFNRNLKSLKLTTLGNYLSV